MENSSQITSQGHGNRDFFIFASDSQTATMAVDDVFDDGQAETGAAHIP